MVRLCVTLLALLFVVCDSKRSHDELRVMTNELNFELLDFYSNVPNNLTDFALQAVRDYLILHNETKIDIPTVDVGFTETILGVDLKGEFEAYDGVFRNPATIVREGESSFKFHIPISNLSTTVGFSNMTVYFPHYIASVIGISESGDVSVHVGKNEIYLEVSIWLHFPKCTVTLTSLKLTKFEDITTKISGLSIFNGLADDITGWVLSSYETSFTTIIEQVVANKLSEVLSKTGGFCKYKSRPHYNQGTSHRKFACQNPNENNNVFKCQKIR